MKISQLFLSLSILLSSLSINAKPVGPFGPYTRALVALGGAAGAGLANGVNSLFDSLKTDKIRDLKDQVENLRGVQELNKELLANYVSQKYMFIVTAGVAVGAACLALAFSQEIASALFTIPAVSNNQQNTVEKA